MYCLKSLASYSYMHISKWFYLQPLLGKHLLPTIFILFVKKYMHFLEIFFAKNTYKFFCARLFAENQY